MCIRDRYIADTLFIKKCRKETSLLMDNALDRYKLLLQTYPNMVKYVNGVKVGTAYVDVFEKQKDTIAVDHGENIAYSEWRLSLIHI